MVIAPSIVPVELGEHRCYPYLADAATFGVLLIHTVAARIGHRGAPLATFNSVFSCRAAQMDVLVPHAGMFDGLVSGERPSLMNLQFLPSEPEPKGVEANGLTRLHANIMGALFSLYVEPAGEWIKRNHSTAYDRWPPVANFCRVVRNAIVHGGTINIQSPTAPGASWRGITYTHRDYGRTVLNTGDLSAGDLIVLMCELDDELDALGAPFDLG